MIQGLPSFKAMTEDYHFEWLSKALTKHYQVTAL
jgi:hypothetical protein